MKPQQPPSEIRQALAEHRRVFMAIGVFSAFINLLYLSPSLYMLQVYDRVITSSSLLTLAALSVLLLGAYLLMAVIELARSRVLVRLGNQLDRKLSYRVFEAAFQRNLKGRRHAAGAAMHDLNMVRQFITGPGLNALLDAPWIPIYIMVIWLLHPLLGMVALGGVLVLGLLAALTEIITHKPLQEANQASQRGNQFATSVLRNTDAIQSMGMLGAFRQRWELMQQELLVRQSQASDHAGTIASATKFFRLSLQSAGLGVGAYLVLQTQITPGMMIAGSILMGRSLAPAEALISTWKQLVGARDAHARLSDMLVENPAAAPRLPLPPPQGLLQLEQVSAAPPGVQVATLKGVTLTARPGEVLAIVGPSASGKSTLARVMAGIWEARGGHVRIDGADMSQWSREDLGPFIGYLPQEVELFDGTVAENIARFRSQDSAAIIDAARRAGLHEIILRLPQGYDTRIGESGANLSGGQRQRVALARALFGNPPLLILDEPNASLDDAGEQALQQALQLARTEGRTIVVITHRSHMLAITDRMAVIKDGQLALHGPRDQVMESLRGPRQPATSAAQPNTTAPS